MSEQQVQAQAQNAPKVRRTLTGVIVCASADKTVRVRVERRTQHRLYGKVMRRRNHFLAHDEQNSYQVGDVVTITETKRYSKRKGWTVTGKAENEK